VIRKLTRISLCPCSGSRYEGDWKDAKACGKGLFVWSFGDRYEGDYRNGKPNGKGTRALHARQRWDRVLLTCELIVCRHLLLEGRKQVRGRVAPRQEARQGQVHLARGTWIMTALSHHCKTSG
jgi:hypothetical protein